MSGSARDARATARGHRRAASVQVSHANTNAMSAHADGVAAEAAPAAASGAASSAAAETVSVPRAEWDSMRQMLQTLMARAEASPPSRADSASPGAAAPAALGSLPSAGASTADVGTLARALQEQQAQLLLQAQRAQAASAAQMLLLHSLGELPTFNGKGSDTTLAAQEWLQRSEDYFAAREQALGIDAAAGDKARVLSAAGALHDDARRWLNALPQRPDTWDALRTAVRARFCSVPDERVRVDRLHEFVDKASRLRDKLNVQGMQAYTARFAQLAGEVPDEYVTLHGKLALLARGLPQRYAEVVLQEDAKRPLPPLHAVINTVLSRAAHKEHAASYAGAAAASASAAPLGLDAVTLAATTFGWSREEAQRHLDESEGWAPYDTDAPPAVPHPLQQQRGGTAPTTAGFSAEQLAQLAAMFGSRSGGDGGGKQSQRRNAPKGVRDAVPEALLEARKQAGLCIKCGVVKYEGGSKGHNAKTCKAAADATTSAAEGKRKAGF